MCSRARATVSLASRWSLESRATPSIRSASPSSPGRTRPAGLHPADPAVRQPDPVLGLVLAAGVQRQGNCRLDLG